ncbi:MAG TPA: OmpA family protein [Vicinamibacteria bacterium]|nr:OmpA family protein [Vicinamibacteria bacterium]
MKRPTRKVTPPMLFMLAAAAVGAQDQDLPAGAKLKVLDIVFKVEDFGGRVADLKVKESDTEVRIELAADVLFDFDKATLLPKAEDTLAKAAAFIRERAAGAVRIEGHTDSKGDDAYNQGLSERRAESVRQWFVRHGLGGVEFAARGFGETQPVAPNTKPNGADDPEARQKNRRVEIVIGKGR